MPQIYFISGVSGVGKTSTIIHLKKLLPADQYDIRDFDEQGVPTGGGPQWHDGETLHWLDVANENAKNNRSTVVCGFQNPKRFRELYKKEEHIPAHLILLHASGDTLRERLLNRHATPESIREINRASGVTLDKFIKDIVSFAPELLSIFQKENLPIVETSTKKPEEVAREISEAILKINSRDVFCE